MDDLGNAFLLDDYVDDEMEPEGEWDRDPVGSNFSIPRPVQIGSLASERAVRSGVTGWQGSRLQTSHQPLAPQYLPDFLALQEENTSSGRQAMGATAKRRGRSAPVAQQELAFTPEGHASRAAVRFG